MAERWHEWSALHQIQLALATHAPQLESEGRENITVELRQDKIEDDPEWRAKVVGCIVACFQDGT